MVPTLIFSPAFEYDWERSLDTDVSPTSFEELGQRYDIDVGAMVIDLRDLPWDGEDITLDAYIDAGNLEIILPDGVGLVGVARVDIGRVAEPGRIDAGFGDSALSWDQPGQDGTVHLDAHVNVGNIDIRR